MSAVEVHGGGVTLTGAGVELFRLLTIARGIKLEAIGMRLTRGRSCLAIAKSEYGFKGSRDKVLAQVLALIQQKRTEAGVTDGELDALVKGSSPL